MKVSALLNVNTRTFVRISNIELIADKFVNNYIPMIFDLSYAARPLCSVTSGPTATGIVLTAGKNKDYHKHSRRRCVHQY